MSIDASLTKHSPHITLKGGMFTLTTIQLFTFDLIELAHQLDEKIKQAPNFFQYAPIIIDLKALRQQTETLDMIALVHLLKSKKLIPIGIRGGITEAMKESAIQAGLALFPEDKLLGKKADSDLLTSRPSAPAEPLTHTPTRLVTQPVRSGQQIYVPGGDLIILSSVGHGAEVLADGHIHIHGPLRGRALAGVMGNKEAMIFCKSLEAELVSIAGQYQLSEDLKETAWKQSVCIQLQTDCLNIRSF